MADTKTSDVDIKHHTLRHDVPVAELVCHGAFDGLTPRERSYAHYIGAASWEGSLICLMQTSVESPYIFSLLQLVFGLQPLDTLKEAALAAGVTEAQWKSFVVYAAGFYANMGNYKGFGDSKIVPDLPEDVFWSIVGASAGAAKHADLLADLRTSIGDLIFSLAPRLRELGFGPAATTTYYSQDCTKADAAFVQRFLEKHDISAYNTRLFKTADGFELRLASAETSPVPGYEAPVEFEGTKIHVTRGDYAPIMARVSALLSAAVAYAANDNQRNMLQCYVKSFSEGSLPAHKDGSRHWIHDKGPAVESYIGFIESYRDPLGSRGEWEGFVAVVNREISAKFGTLVNSAESLLRLMPWDSAFEKDRFLRPDFTALEVVAFASSGIPAGINIPNYDEIRQTEGFKNVSLANVLSARDPKDRTAFIAAADQDMLRRLLVPSFEVQVGLHELLGHGSGKLFTKDADGKLNYEPGLINPITNAPVASCYLPGQTWDSQFPVIGPAVEECRAECVGLYLCLQEQVLKVFGHEGEEGDDVVYINWLSMARAGLQGLMFYSPATKAWGQAHMQARFAILQVMLQNGIAEIKNLEAVTPDAIARLRAAGAEASIATELGVEVVVHRDRIATVGREAIGRFLLEIQVYKATADYSACKALFDRLTTVPDSWLPMRDLVMINRKERNLFVQAVTSIGQGGQVTLERFAPSVEGLVQSFARRFPAVDTDLVAAAHANRKAVVVA